MWKRQHPIKTPPRTQRAIRSLALDLGLHPARASCRYARPRLPKLRMLPSLPWCVAPFMCDSSDCNITSLFVKQAAAIPTQSLDAVLHLKQDGRVAREIETIHELAVARAARFGPGTEDVSALFWAEFEGFKRWFDPEETTGRGSA